MQRYLRNQISHSPQITSRGLNSNQPQGILQYCKALKTWLNTSTIESELTKISQDSIEEMDNNTQEYLKHLDEQFTQARYSAEQGLHKYSSHPWSPQLKQAQLQVYYWKLWVSQSKTKKSFKDQRSKLQLESLPTPHTQRQAPVSYTHLTLPTIA